jgi:hypothetical protein
MGGLPFSRKQTVSDLCKFCRDMSMSIDKDEMRGVLLTFSIELTEDQIDQLMTDFGASDKGDGLGKTIRYPGRLLVFRPESPATPPPCC